MGFLALHWGMDQLSKLHAEVCRALENGMPAAEFRRAILAYVRAAERAGLVQTAAHWRSLAEVESGGRTVRVQIHIST